MAHLLQQHIASEFNDRESADIKVCTGDTTYFLHKIVLRQSSYFKSAMKDVWASALSASGKLVLALPSIPLLPSMFHDDVDDDDDDESYYADATSAALNSAVDFCLRGLYGLMNTKAMDMSNLRYILQAATYLDVPAVVTACLVFVHDNLDGETASAFVSMVHGLEIGPAGHQVEDLAMAFIHRHAFRMRPEQLADLPLAVLVNVLTCKTLWIPDEFHYAMLVAVLFKDLATREAAFRTSVVANAMPISDDSSSSSSSSSSVNSSGSDSGAGAGGGSESDDNPDLSDVETAFTAIVKTHARLEHLDFQQLQALVEVAPTLFADVVAKAHWTGAAGRDVMLRRPRLLAGAKTPVMLRSFRWGVTLRSVMSEPVHLPDLRDDRFHGRQVATVEEEHSAAVHFCGSLWVLEARRYISPSAGAHVWQESLAVYLRRDPCQLLAYGRCPQCQATCLTSPAVSAKFVVRLCGSPGAGIAHSIVGAAAEYKLFGSAEAALNRWGWESYAQLSKLKPVFEAGLDTSLKFRVELTVRPVP